MAMRDRETKRVRGHIEVGTTALLVFFLGLFGGIARAQTDCAGNGVLDTAPPKNLTVPELIQKFSARDEGKRSSAALHLHARRARANAQ